MVGLDDVVAAETALSDVDGLAGRLIIAGHSLDALAGRATLEDMAGLLLGGGFDRPITAHSIGNARAAVHARLAPALAGLAKMPVFDAMRAAMARLDDDSSLDAALALLAAPAVLVPALLRLQAGHAAVAPDADLPHAADVLRMLSNTRPDAAQVGGLDTYLVTVADHGLNASTFTARVIASTQAGLVSSGLGALGALKGPLHGGAPGPVLDMLDAVGTPANAAPWIDAALKRGERLMGFGHRIYRVRDPRADALQRALERLRKAGFVDADRMALAAAVETAALEALARHKPDRPLKTNVEFYTALLLEALGFPREAFTAVFAMGRMTGWIAHAREQATGGRLIRPRSLYVGPAPREAA